MRYRRLPSQLAFLAVAALVPSGRVAAAPPGACFVAQNGTVRDGRTMLVWQQSLNTTGGDGSGKFTWDQARTYCASLPLDGGGFRLPTHNELMSILDYSRSSPAIDPTAFPQTPNGEFWSASPVVTLPGRAWNVDFGAGFTSSSLVVSALRVRCVR